MRIDNCALLWPIALCVNACYAYERYIYTINTPHVRNIYIICAKLVIYTTTAKFSA